MAIPYNQLASCCGTFGNIDLEPLNLAWGQKNVFTTKPGQTVFSKPQGVVQPERRVSVTRELEQLEFLTGTAGVHPRVLAQKAWSVRQKLTDMPKWARANTAVPSMSYDAYESLVDRLEAVERVLGVDKLSPKLMALNAAGAFRGLGDLYTPNSPDPIATLAKCIQGVTCAPKSFCCPGGAPPIRDPYALPPNGGGGGGGGDEWDTKYPPEPPPPWGEPKKDPWGEPPKPKETWSELRSEETPAASLQTAQSEADVLESAAQSLRAELAVGNTGGQVIASAPAPVVAVTSTSIPVAVPAPAPVTAIATGVSTAAQDFWKRMQAAGGIYQAPLGPTVMSVAIGAGKGVSQQAKQSTQARPGGAAPGTLFDSGGNILAGLRGLGASSSVVHTKVALESLRQRLRAARRGR